MGRGPSKKMPFEDLDSDFKTAIEAMTDDEVRRRISDVAINEHENREHMKKDVDLMEQKEKTKEAGAQYAEASKMNRLRISYAHHVLDSRGKL